MVPGHGQAESGRQSETEWVEDSWRSGKDHDFLDDCMVETLRLRNGCMMLFLARRSAGLDIAELIQIA